MSALGGSSYNWRPEEDGDYGRHLLGHLVLKYRWLLLLGAFLGALVFGVVSLFQPRVYSAMGTLIVDKQSSEGTSLLGGIPLLGGGTSLETEVQLLTSRASEWPVIERLGLNVEVVDLQPADSPLLTIERRLTGGRAPEHSRTELFSRVRLSNIQVDPELLKPASYILEGTAGGGWRVGDKSGGPGERVVLDHVSFDLEFGPAHEPGFRYALAAKPRQTALEDFDGNFSVGVSASVLRLTFRHHNPIVCERVINEIMAQFLQAYEANKTTDFGLILGFIDREVAERERRIDELSAELTEYQSENEVYLPSSQGSAAITQWKTLEAEQQANQIQLLTIENVLRGWEERSAEDLSESIQAPATALPLEQGLVTQLAEAIARLRNARLTKTELHPDVIAIRQQVELLKEQIRQSLESSASGLRTANRELGTTIGEARAQLRTLPEAESRIFNLTSELEVNAEILATLQKSQADTLLRQASAEREARVLDEALVPVKKDSPRIGRNTALGAAAGLVALALIALLLEAGNRRIRSLREVRLGLGLPVLAALPGPKPGPRWHPTDRGERLLRRVAAFIGLNGQTVAIVHLPEAGSSFDLAWGLAGAAGEGEKPVLLVDADRLDLSLCAALGRDVPHSLTEAAAGEVGLERCLVQLDERRWLAQLGPGALDPGKLALVLAALREWYSAVVICLPPSLQWNGQERLAPLLDTLVVALPQGSLRLEELQEAVSDLAGLGLQARGVVVTNYSPRRDILGAGELRFIAVPPTGRSA